MEKIINIVISEITNDDIIDLNILKNKVSKLLNSDKMDYVRKNVDSPEINQKIETFLINTGLNNTVEECKIEITNNDLFCAWFIKDTGKQNVYEKLQFNILKNLYGKNINKIPSTGKNSKFINENKISNKQETSTKSLDFIENYNGLMIYYFGKYTKDTVGGAQDNQASDALSFLKDAYNYTNNINDNLRFVLLCDGDYYKSEKFKNLANPYLTNKVKLHDINSIKNEKWDD